jgi:anti-anti-sigma regulatory factor
MLRVTTGKADPGTMVIEAHGSIAAEGVGVLTRVVESKRNGRRLVLDLKGVRFADRAGVDLLRRWAAEDVEMRGASPYLRAVLTE